MKTISSRDNALYKDLKVLASSAQARRKVGRTVLDGVHLCQAYLDVHGVPTWCIVSETSHMHPEVTEILRRCEAARVACVMLPDAMYQALSQVENGIGLLFVVDTPKRSHPARMTDSSVLLENLQDPGNLGSILRSAAAAGIKAIYCSKGTVSPWSPKVLRAGMGGHFLLEIFENVELSELVMNSGIPVIATSSHANEQLYGLDLRGEAAWLFGHEGQGVSEALLELATHQIAIPHLGKIESLNVAASAAVCFFEQVRQKTQASFG